MPTEVSPHRGAAQWVLDLATDPLSPMLYGLAVGLHAASLGDFDAAFAWFDCAFEERDALMACVHVYTDLFVPALARDPRFRSVLERMRLTDVAV